MKYLIFQLDFFHVKRHLGKEKPEIMLRSAQASLTLLDYASNGRRLREWFHVSGIS